MVRSNQFSGLNTVSIPYMEKLLTDVMTIQKMDYGGFGYELEDF